MATQTVMKDKSKVFDKLASIVGEKNIAQEKYKLSSYTRDQGILARGRYPDIVVKPRSTEEIKAILRLANQLNFPVYPRSGGTSPFGYWPVEGGIVVDVSGMNKVLDVDEGTFTVTCQPGVPFAELEKYLYQRGWRYLVAPEGSLGGTVGGHVAYRGGSPFTFLIENQAAAVTGLRVVLPTGELVTTGARAYEKADSHFNRYSWCNDLTGLFLGAEGTMGIITEVGLKVEQLPETMGHMTYGFPDYDSAIKALWGTRKAQIPASFVFLSDGRTMDIIDPEHAPHNLEALVKWSRIGGRKAVVEDALATGHEICRAAGGKDLGEGMARDLWEDRYYNAAAYLYAFGSRLTFHAVVPLGRAAKFLKLGRQLQTEMREKYNEPMSVSGHPMDRAFLILLSFGTDVRKPGWPEEPRKKFNHIKNTMLDAGAVVYRAAIEYGADQLYRTGEYYELMKKLKQCVDPKGIMAPGYAGLNYYKPGKGGA